MDDDIESEKSIQSEKENSKIKPRFLIKDFKKKKEGEI